jgi:hypothetical protein
MLHLANYADLRAAFGSDETAAAQHFIIHGAAEGRTDDAPAVTSDADTVPVTLSPVPGQMIVGTDTADTLVGTPGDDTIHGGNAQDTMAGGDGADIFTFGSRWTPAPAPKMWDGGDRITDFQPGMDKLDFSALISAKGYDGAFVGADGFSTNPPIPRDFNSYQFIHGSFEDVEVGYRHERMSDGSEVTTVVLDGPVHIGSAKFNLTPMDGNVDARVTLVGVHTLTASDVIS